MREDRRDGDERVRLLSPVGRAIALLLAPHAEVVLHDAQSDEVLAIWNPLSGRAAGDPSELGELDALEPAADGVFGPYPKNLADGRRLSSVSAVLRTPAGEPSVALCVNVDRTPLEHAASVLGSFAAPVVPRPEPLFEHDHRQRIHDVIGAFVRQQGRPVARLTRSDRVAVLGELEAAGTFAVRRAVPIVATALGVSRSTVYALLTEVRGARP